MYNAAIFHTFIISVGKLHPTGEWRQLKAVEIETKNIKWEWKQKSQILIYILAYKSKPILYLGSKDSYTYNDSKKLVYYSAPKHVNPKILNFAHPHFSECN